MNIAELDQHLTVTSGQLTLADDTLPGAGLGSLLTEYVQGHPLVISQAVKQPLRAHDTSVTVRGAVSLLGLASLPVTATFTLDSKGNPRVSVRMPLNTSAGGWTFRHTFPNLPGFKGSWGSGGSDPLDTLGLTGAALVLSTFATTDPTVKAPVAVGLNFVAKGTLPSWLPAPIKTLLGSVAAPVVAGTITLDSAAASPAPLTPGQWPWDASPPVPGLNLSIDLGAAKALRGTKITLQDVQLRIYTPTDAAWAKANPTYTPAVALTASLALGSGLHPIDLVATVAPNLGQVTLLAQFDGQSVPNLSELAILAGSANLFAALPAELQAAGQGLGGISLTAAGLDLTVAKGAVSVATAYLTAALPSQKLPLSVGELAGLTANFTVTDPFGSPKVDLQIEGTGTIAELGSASFDITVDVGPDLTASGKLTGATLPLQALFTDLHLPAPADLTIDSAEIDVAKAGVSLSATLADDPAWVLGLGPLTLSVSDLALTAANTSGSWTATFGGQLALGSALVLTVGYQLPGSFRITGAFADTTLSALVAAFGLPFAVPAGFDLSLDDSSVMISGEQGDLTFTAATDITQVGLFTISVSRTSGTWGFVAGVDLAVASLATTAGLAALTAFEQFTGLDDLALVVSTITDPQFTFPDLTALPAPQLSGAQIKLPAAAGGVTPGLTVYGSLTAANSQGLQALASWLGVRLDGSVAAIITVALPDPAAGSRLAIAVSAQVDGVTITGQLGAMLSSGQPTLYLTGTATVPIQGQPVTFSLAAAVTEDGVFVSGGYTGTISFTFAPGGPAVQLSDVGLAVGLDFEGVPSVGFTATIDVGNFDASVAVFLDSVNPAQSMFAGSVSDVTLAGIAEALAGQASIPTDVAGVLSQVSVAGISSFTLPATAATALDNRDLGGVAAAFAPFAAIPSSSSGLLLVVSQPGQSWHLTDLTTMTHYSLSLAGTGIAVAVEAQIYCAPVATAIGPTSFPAGFHVDAAVDLYVVHVERLRVVISPGSGIAADATLDPITFGPPGFFAVTGVGGQAGPRFSVGTFTQTAADEPDPNCQPPHLLVSGALTLLGTQIASIYLYASPTNFTFQISADIPPGSTVISLSISGHVGSLDDLGASGTVTVGETGTVNLGTLGQVPVNTQVSGAFSLGYENGIASASVSGSASLNGLGSVGLPTVDLVASGSKLTDLPGLFWTEIQQAYQVFTAKASQWLQLVANGVITGVNGAAQVGEVLYQNFGQTPGEIAALMHGYSQYGPDQIAQAMQVAGANEQVVASTLSGLGYQAQTIVQTLGSVFPGHISIDLGHTDIPQGPHADVPHGDLFGATITPHGDGPLWPHTDAPTHIDS